MNNGTTAERAAAILEGVHDTLLDRDAEYRGSDLMYAELMAVLFPSGLELVSAHDHHRFHLFMLAMVKVTRYARNWNEGGHADSLTDLAAYAAMLKAVDASGDPGQPGAGA